LPILARAMNTGLRFSRGLICRVACSLTRAVADLPAEVVSRAVTIVQTFNDFTEDNDPHGEHDFFRFEVAGETFFWKCDYYDKDLQFGSNDPSDLEKTTRVATLMLASDY
jgi:hypothetical protein